MNNTDDTMLETTEYLSRPTDVLNDLRQQILAAYTSGIGKLSSGEAVGEIDVFKIESVNPQTGKREQRIYRVDFGNGGRKAIRRMLIDIDNARAKKMPEELIFKYFASLATPVTEVDGQDEAVSGVLKTVLSQVTAALGNGFLSEVQNNDTAAEESALASRTLEMIHHSLANLRLKKELGKEVILRRPKKDAAGKEIINPETHQIEMEEFYIDFNNPGEVQFLSNVIKQFGQIRQNADLSASKLLEYIFRATSQ